MAKKTIDSKVWKDNFFSVLTPKQKLLWLYLITCDFNNMLGIYEINLRIVSFDTGLSLDEINDYLALFESKGKIVVKGDYLNLVNFLKHQNYNPNMKKSALNVYQDLPDEMKIEGYDYFDDFDDMVKAFGFANKVLEVKKPNTKNELFNEFYLKYNKIGDYFGNDLNYPSEGAGSGGDGVNIANYLMEDWVDDKGNKHRGLIDKEYSADYVSKYPNAINKLKLVSPTQYKSIIYEALIEMMNLDCISFTNDYDNKGYLTLFEVDDKLYNSEKKRISEELKKQNIPEAEFAQKVEEEMKKSSCIKTKIVKLDPYQEIALKNIDAMKEEMVNMVRKKRDSGKDSFDLIPEKANKLHDDRSYCAALCAWALSEKRAERIRNKKRTTNYKLIDMLPVTPRKQVEKIFG